MLGTLKILDGNVSGRYGDGGTVEKLSKSRV
jgi:hypothetical protein